jgi:hypothetical protein
MINFFQNLSLFRVKNADFFRKIFRRKYFKNHNIGPWSPCLTYIHLLTKAKLNMDICNHLKAVESRRIGLSEVQNLKNSSSGMILPALKLFYKNIIIF